MSLVGAGPVDATRPAGSIATPNPSFVTGQYGQFDVQLCTADATVHVTLCAS